MLDHVLGHVVRRGMEAHASFQATEKPSPEEPAYEMPIWGAVLLIVTGLVFVLVLGMIEYTYGNLVPALAMVESPSAVLFEPVASEDPDAPLGGKKPSGPSEQELYLIKQAPITAKLRTTVLHLRERAGVWSRFRGISIWLVYHFVLARLAQFFSMWHFIPWGADGILAALVLANIRMGWTHIVISEPSGKSWFRCLPSLKLWKKIALPTFVLAVCEEITAIIPFMVFIATGAAAFKDPQEIADLNGAQRGVLLAKMFAALFLFLFSAVAIVIPAIVTLTRVQASLLPEEVETIVPFDRTFGGRFVPAVAGGSGVISMLEAWKTFSWNSRMSLLRLYGKVMLIETAAIFAFAFALAGELHLIMGPEVGKYASWVRGSMQH